MVCKSARGKLIELINFKIYTLIRTHSFPLSLDVGLLSLDVGLLSLREGFRKAGYVVELDDTHKVISFDAEIYQPEIFDGFSFSTTYTYDEVKRGGRNDVPLSISAIDYIKDSIFLSLVKNSPKQSKNSLLTDYIVRSRNICNNAINMYVHNQIHERGDAILLNKMLMPSSQNYSSRVLEEVIDRYDIEAYENALEVHKNNSESVSCVAEAHKLLTTPWSKFNEYFCPYPVEFEKFFWGAYLHELYRLKGYDITLSRYCPIESFIRSGSQMLKKGTEVEWGKLANA